MENNMTKEQIKQTIEGFTSFMRGICNNPNLNVPKELADKYDISEEFREKMEGCAETKKEQEDGNGEQ